MLNQYLNGSSHLQLPSFSVAVFTILLGLVLSTVLALTCKITFQEEHCPNDFFLAMVVNTIVAAIVMMVVGDNLAVGFVVLGAISMMLFRNLIRNPHNIIFIFASLSIGIATGKLSYVIAISGTTLFCYIVFLLFYAPVESDQN